MVARNAGAVSGPTPGTPISRRQTGSSRTTARICLVSRASSRVMTSTTASSGSAPADRTRSPDVSSRTRAANFLRLGLPSLRPVSRSSARTPFSMSRILFSTSRRAASRARQERQAGLFTCTARNQPVRTICAIARASFRSVLFGMAPIAALARRVSRHTAGRPAAVSPSYSQAASEHASSPTRSGASPRPWRNATSASGSLGTRASRTIRPSSSTTHTVASSRDTSSPAKYFTAAPPRCSWPMHTDHAPPSLAEQPPPVGSPNHSICLKLSRLEHALEAHAGHEQGGEHGHVPRGLVAHLVVDAQATVALQATERLLDHPPARQHPEPGRALRLLAGSGPHPCAGPLVARDLEGPAQVPGEPIVQPPVRGVGPQPVSPA